MAQTIDDIQSEIIAAKEADANLAGLTSTSKVSIWRLWTYVFASSAWNLQKKHDAHKEEVQSIVDSQKAHRPGWYEDKALKFQYGRSLVQDQDYYDNTGLSEAAIEAERIIKYVALEEVRKGFRIKAVKETAGELAQLSFGELNAFMTYMNRIKDAGVHLYGESNAADSLKLTLTIYYDPLVLDAMGARIDGTSPTPIADAVDAYIKSRSFNGLFVNATLTDELQKIDGVIIPNVDLAQAKYGAFPYAPFTIEYKPDAGWLRFANPADLVINYLPHGLL